MRESTETSPRWLELRMEGGRFMGEYDPEREILRLVYRGEVQLFDLREMREREAQFVKHGLRSGTTHCGVPKAALQVQVRRHG